MSNHCHNCDHVLNPDAEFCANCGVPTVRGVPDNIAMPSEGGVATPPTAPEPRPAWSPDPEPAPGYPTAGPAYPAVEPAYPTAAGAAPSGAASVPGYQAGGQQPGGQQPGGQQPGGQPPPPFAPSPFAAEVPSGPQFTAVDGPARSGRGKGSVIGITLGVVGLLVISVLAVRFLRGGSDTGGASSPEAVVEEMVAAINAKDPLAAVDLMAPDELDGVDTLVEDATQYYRDLGLGTVLDEQNPDSNVEVTLDLEADRIDARMEGDRAAVVSFELSGSVEVTGAERQLGDDSAAYDFSRRDLAGALPNGSDAVELIAVQLDGRWYASPMLTAGHYIVENAGLPSGEYDKIGADRDPGADSPVAAVDALVDVVNDPDADSLAAVLGGGEGRVAVAFHDAIDEGLSDFEAGVDYELSVDTSDVGDGRVQLDQIDLTVNDEFDGGTVSVEDGCATVRPDDGASDRTCLLESLGIDRSDVDTSLFLGTVDEDGGRRVRIVPTVTDVLGRFLDVFDDRQTLLYAFDSAQLDSASTVEPGSDVSIEFDGQLYAVNEFAVEAGEAYNVTTSGDTRSDVFVDDGFGMFRPVAGQFVAEEDEMARVVTYSDIAERDDCGAIGCLPSGRGRATVRIRQAARQSVPFPQRVTGDFGPGDVRLFELEIESEQTITLGVTGEGIDWRLVDSFEFSVDDDTFDLPTGTYELVVYNTSGDDDTSYDINPTSG